MKQVTHIEKRGKWGRPDPNAPRQCCACSATSDRRKAMPTQWEHRITQGESLFTCSTLCRLQKGWA
jgi:hypothetical protein